METKRILFLLGVSLFVITLGLWEVFDKASRNSDQVEAQSETVDFSMEVVGAGCSTKQGAATKCSVLRESIFTAQVNLNSFENFPDADNNGIAGYLGFDILLYYSDGLTFKSAAMRNVWPDCAFEAHAFFLGVIAIGCAVTATGTYPNVDFLESTYLGPIMRADFNCGTEPSAETITLVHGRSNTKILDEFIYSVFDPDGNEVLTINCVEPVTPTPTETPTVTSTPTPTITPTNTPTPTPTPVERTAVVFLRGLGSSLSIEELRKIVRDNECQDDEAFGVIIQVLQAGDSQKYQCDNLLFFSYHSIPGTDPPQSGFVVLGEWTPAPYECTETGQSLAESGELLRNMLKAYQDYWESEGEKVKFVLVGHSLGGLVAFQELLPLINDGFNIKRLITFDSPLEGRPSLGLVEILAFLSPNPICSGQLVISDAADEITILAELPEVRERNQEIVREVSPTQVITLGDKHDCVYWLGWCVRSRRINVERFPPRITVTYVPKETGRWRDNTQTQLVQNASFAFLYEDGLSCNAVRCPRLIAHNHGVIRITRSLEIAEFITEGP